MSRSTSATITCPACQSPVKFERFDSVNTSQQPEVRQLVLEHTLGRATCACGAVLHPEPELLYVDHERHQWIRALPFTRRAAWSTEENTAKAAFELGYGPEAPGVAQGLGKELEPRVTFGWAGLREKVLIAQHGLDDVVVELAKLLVMRNSGSLDLNATLRLLDVSPEGLTFCWLRGAEEDADEGIEMVRSGYDDVANDLASWEELRANVSAGLYVDVRRTFT